MAELLSPDNVFDFSDDDPTLNLEDDPELDIEEDPEMDIDDDQEMDVPHVVAPLVGSPPISPPPLSESSSNFDIAAPVTSDKTLWVPSIGSTFEIRRPSSVTPTPPHLLEHELRSLRQDTDALHGSATDRVESDVLALQARVETVEARLLQAEQDRIRDREEVQRLKTRVELAKISATLGAVEARPTDSIDVLAVYGDARPSELQGPPDGSQ
uniref:Uncharacterized protein n=1 Tax=Tanacetum cinerariifolium TaxID=118510 RepID=A0A6L2KL55_TANCI|nr:hypothetical protein [Tanacetum cinerariifolium]